MEGMIFLSKYTHGKLPGGNTGLQKQQAIQLSGEEKPSETLGAV